MISPRHFALLTALTAGALGSWYLARQGESGAATEVPYEPAERGYYLKSARNLGTGESGAFLYEI